MIILVVTFSTTNITAAAAAIATNTTGTDTGSTNLANTITNKATLIHKNMTLQIMIR
jgi:hypothetical protein